VKIKLPDDLKGQKISLPGERKPSKYKAQRTEYNGRWYDSKGEAGRARDLDLMKLSGQVKWWLPQVPIFVGEVGVDKPWRLDFVVAEPWYMPSGREVVYVWAEDWKGAKTQSFLRHCRQWRLRGPFELRIITKSGTEIIEGGGG